MRRLRIVRADPAGNITLFVLTPVEKAACAAIAADLMKIGELKAEQVKDMQVLAYPLQEQP